MHYCIWDDDNWDTLLHAIRQNNCILMLGPDSATEIVKGKYLPHTEILANELAEKIDGEDREKINTSDLAQVAQYYCHCMYKGRQSLEARVAAFYEERKGGHTTLHQTLAALPFYLIVTTTPDRMYQEALKKESKVPILERYHFKGYNYKMVEMGTVEKPLIFYLYGSLDEPGSLVLTENDILDFMEGLISDRRPMPRNVLSELRDESKNFLFFGFGFKHWYLRILLHVLQGRKKGSPSFAMEQFPPEYAPAFK